VQTSRSTDAARSITTLLREQQAFIEGDVIVHLAVADRRCVPHLAIGAGCWVTPEAPRVTVLIDRAQSRSFLDVLAETRRIAVEFGRAPGHESIQIKGSDCVIETADADARRVAVTYRDKLARQLAVLGLASAATDLYLGLPFADLVALHFTPTALFQQMPGPQAGQALA